MISPQIREDSFDRGDGEIVFGYEIQTNESDFAIEVQFQNPENCLDGHENEFRVVISNGNETIEIHNHTDVRLHSMRGSNFKVHVEHKNFRTPATPWELSEDLRKGSETHQESIGASLWFDKTTEEANSKDSYRVKVTICQIAPAKPKLKEASQALRN